MARTLSNVAIESAQALTTSEVWLLLLEIDHADLAAPFYLVNNTESILHDGNTYLAYPFSVILAEDTGDKLPTVKLTIDNVDRALVDTIRSISDSPSVNIKLVLASQPSIIELEISELVLREVEYDAFTITGTLFADDILNSRFPRDNINLAAGYEGLL